MKKILIIGSTPPPYHGSNLYNLNLLNSKINDYFELYHLDTSDKRSLDNIGKVDFTNIKLGISNLFSLIRMIRKQRPDIVYIPIAQNIAFIRDALFIIISKFFNCKIIIHLHGGNFLNYYNETNLFYKKFIDFALKRVNTAIVLGDSLKYIFKKWVKNIISVPNGLDFSFEFRKKYYSDNKKLNLGYLGNISEEKGIIDLIESFRIISSKYEHIILNIAGEWLRGNGSFQRNVSRLIKKYKLENKINFLGYVSLKQKEKFFIDTDIFIYPSWNEGQPLAILEAMAAGCPVIANRDVGVISETVVNGKTGILVDKTKIEELSLAILKLIENKSLRSEMGKNSYKRFLECYTLDKNIEKLISVFNNILGQK